MASPHSNTMFIVSIAINTVEYVLQSWLCCCSFYKYIIHLCSNQGRQTRQNSGGVADLTKGGGVTKNFAFYVIKI